MEKKATNYRTRFGSLVTVRATSCQCKGLKETEKGLRESMLLVPFMMECLLALLSSDGSAFEKRSSPSQRRQCSTSCKRRAQSATSSQLHAINRFGASHYTAILYGVQIMITCDSCASMVTHFSIISLHPLSPNLLPSTCISVVLVLNILQLMQSRQLGDKAVSMKFLNVSHGGLRSKLIIIK